MPKQKDFQAYWDQHDQLRKDYKASMKKYGPQYEETYRAKIRDFLDKGFNARKVSRVLAAVQRYVNEEYWYEAGEAFSAGGKGRTAGYVVEDLVRASLDKLRIAFESEIRYSDITGTRTDMPKKIDIWIPFKDSDNGIIVFCQKSLFGGGAQTDRIQGYLEDMPRKAKRRGDELINLQWDEVVFQKDRAESKYFIQAFDPKRAKHLMYLSSFVKYMRELKKQGVV
jgi:hypothetical protein